MKKMLFAFMLMLLSVPIYSQSISNPIFTHGSKIDIKLSGESDYYYVHKMQKGQSLYALSKIFNVAVINIYQLNNLQIDATISIGQQIKIPIKVESILTDMDLPEIEYGHYIPVHYRTKPKDNLFRIARIYFNQSIENLARRNNLESNNLALGQDILIGWFPIDGQAPVVQSDEFEEDFDIPESKPEFSNSDTAGPLKTENRSEIIDLETSIDTSNLVEEQPDGFNQSLLGSLAFSKSMKETKNSEVANWDKTMQDNGMVYVLHKTAILDSYIEMYNPLVRRSVRAKVIGRIPYGAYTNDVNLVLSPRAAKQLGALDNRFKVEVKALVYDKI